MLAEFAKWLNTQPREKRASIINKFVEVYATKPNEELISALQRQIASRDRRIGELNSYILELEYKAKHPDLRYLYNAAIQYDDFKTIRQQIVCAWEYKNLAERNKKLRKEIKQLKIYVRDLIYKLHAPGKASDE